MLLSAGWLKPFRPLCPWGAPPPGPSPSDAQPCGKVGRRLPCTPSSMLTPRTQQSTRFPGRALDILAPVGSKNQTGLALCREHGIVWGRLIAIGQIPLANTYDGPFVAVVIEIKELHRHSACGCL